MFNITLKDVEKYTIEITVTCDWVAYKDPRFDFNTPSLRPARFNEMDTAAFYCASGENVAKVEIPNWNKLTRCTLTPRQVIAFDLRAYSKDKGNSELFLLSQAASGYGNCQIIAKELTEKFAVSALLFSSAPMNQKGLSGTNMVIIPLNGSLSGDTLFVA